MEKAFGLHEGAAPGADAEKSSVRSVHSDRPRRAGVGHRLSVHERAGALLGQPRLLHRLERRIRREHARPEGLAVPRIDHGIPRRGVFEALRPDPG
ncbi:MAG TPA: hypothetical protein VIJ73_06465, partial [Methylomirabilota bacterium]